MNRFGPYAGGNEAAQTVTGAAPPAYVGPGNVVAGALAWYGLRAYSAATAGNNCIDIIRASDSTTTTFKTLANGNIDLAAITTFLTSTTGKISKIYDQTGNGLDLINANDATRPTFGFAVLGTFPAQQHTAGLFLSKASAGSPISTQPWTASAVAIRASSTAFQGLMEVSGSTNAVVVGYPNAANKAGMYAGSGWVSATAADGSPHSLVYIANSSTSSISVDGSTTGSLNPGTRALTSGDNIIGKDNSGSNFVGSFFEGGWWGGAFSGPNITAMTSNQRTYWGF